MQKLQIKNVLGEHCLGSGEMNVVALQSSVEKTKKECRVVHEIGLLANANGARDDFDREGDFGW